MNMTGFSGKRRVAKAFAVLLAVILIAGPAGCAGDFGGRYELTIQSTDGGSVTAPGEGASTHYGGTVVELVAAPDEGYVFAGWTGDVETIADADAPETTILINKHFTITASFEHKSPVLYSLTISNCTGGAVTTPGAGTFAYEAGTTVEVTADPAAGYLFSVWTGDTDTVADVHSPTTTIVMNDDYSIEPGFETYWIEIWDWHDLHAIRDDPEESYLLMTDLDATTPGYQELAGPNAHGGQGWLPIAHGYWNGTAWIGGVFAGDFHGQGYEISDLVMTRPQESIGLFGCVGTGGTIEAVGIVNADVVGRGIMGSLVAYNNGGTVHDCYSSGNVRGSLDVGGLVGWNWGTVSNCYSAAAVNSNDQYVGGLVGWNSHILKNSYSSGSVKGRTAVGGLVGGNGHGGIISDSYSTAEVYGERFVGGLVGYLRSATVTRSYSTGSVTGCPFTGFRDYGGLVGRSYLATVSDSFWDVESSGVEVSDGGAGKSTPQMKAMATYTNTATEGLDEAWDMVAVAPGQTDDTHQWNIVEGQTYPFLGWEG